jgi:hypothetical protein
VCWLLRVLEEVSALGRGLDQGCCAQTPQDPIPINCPVGTSYAGCGIRGSSMWLFLGPQVPCRQKSQMGRLEDGSSRQVARLPLCKLWSNRVTLAWLCWSVSLASHNVERG